MLTIQNYTAAESLEQAYELNQKRTNIILGGTLWLKMSSKRVHTAIDLSKLGLDTIEEEEHSFSIGAMCSLRQLETHTSLNKTYQNLFKESLRHIVGVQFRSCATVGGSVFGRYGFSDVITALLALNAEVELYKRGIVSLEEFLTLKKDSDILVRIHIRKDGRDVCYHSQRMSATDFPIISCAVSRKENDWYFAVGARPGRAMLHTLTPDTVDPSRMAKEVADSCLFGSNMRASEAYRRHLAYVYIKRGIISLTGGMQDEN